MVDVDIDDLRKVFDTAVNSLDFGSGFLDNDEVEALRRVAVVLGVDPKKATPINFRATYPEPPEPPKPKTPQDLAASAGHYGVAFGWSDEAARIERYQCRCGWSGRFVEFDAHLLDVAKA